MEIKKYKGYREYRACDHDDGWGFTYSLRIVARTQYAGDASVYPLNLYYFWRRREYLHGCMEFGLWDFANWHLVNDNYPTNKATILEVL